MKTVAVLGAGFQGVCVALELASRGVPVDLFDRRSICITQAGANNEGKIHLGFVFSNDPSFETARLLARGALAFGPAVSRWTEQDIAEIGVSTPHRYAVQRGSVVPPDTVCRHFTRVCDLIHELGHARGASYLGEDARSVGFSAEGVGSIYNPQFTTAVLCTSERSVNVRRLTERLRTRVAAEPRIRFHPDTEITSAQRDGDRIAIGVSRGGVADRRQYREVVNCLWAGKLAIDHDMQMLPGYRMLHRVKYGVTIAFREPNVSVPSTTFVVGSYGDVVQIDDRHLYLSWYPIARRGVSHELTPPDWPAELEGDDADGMIDGTLDAFGRLMAPIQSLHHGLFDTVRVTGGVILAAGHTDIDDPRSRLHTRSAVGVCSVDGYHSIDPGKYTLVPMFAIEAADRICGKI